MVDLKEDGRFNDLDQQFPCKGCEWRDTSSCTKACFRLHKFLREDLKCHTRVRTTELVLSPEFITFLSDKQQVNPTQLTWQEMAGNTIGYWDITLAKNLTVGEKSMISSFYLDGLSYKQIAAKYQISLSTVKRQLISIKKRLRKLSASEL